MALKQVPMYIKNVAKSIKYSGKNYLQEAMPESADFLTTNSEILREVTTDLRNYKTIYQSAKAWWNDNSFSKTLQEAKNNAIKDLKTGNFYNYDRENKATFEGSDWEEVLGGFDEDIKNATSGFSEETINAQNMTTNAIGRNTEATVGIMSAVGKAVSETTANSAQFIVNAQNEATAKNMVNNYKMFSNVTNLLADISANNKSIKKYKTKI